MRLFISWTLAPVLVTWAVVACAYTTHENVTRPARTQERRGVEQRAPRGIVVPMQRVGNHLTWRGHLARPQVFPTALPKEEMRAAARATFEAAIESVPWAERGSFLVSVMHVPGKGLSAGSIWKGDEAGFDTWAQAEAPTFWVRVPGGNQALLQGVNNERKWHSEAVAAVVAEGKFSAGGQWPPLGTRIATYGARYQAAIGPKDSCREHASSLQVPCAAWLGRMQVGIVPAQG
jgi:hypothetical protein